MPAPTAAVVEAILEPVKRIRLAGWAGVYAGKLVYDSLSAVGVFLEQGGGFRVDPLTDLETGHAAVAALLPGRRYLLRVTVWGPPGPETLVLALGAGLPPALRLHEARARTLELPAPRPLAWEEALELLRQGAAERQATVYELHHGPTFYRHYAAVVAYPSPRRLWSSIARRLAEAIANNTGQEPPDYRPLALLLGEATELTLDQTKKHHILLGHGRRQKVFQGRARYRLAAPPELAEAATQLLEAAKTLGLGGSPGLGLGALHQAKTLEQAKPQQLPPGDTTWD